VQASERNSLIDGHLGKVRLIARLLARRLPSWVEWRDLENSGIVAMIEAAERFDPAQGQFWPFVYRAVRGAMLDFVGANCRGTCHVELSGVRVFATDTSEKMSRELDLARAMKKLTTQERRVFVALRQGHQTRQIAGMLNITPQRVGQLRKKAARRLRDLVA
jgi:RNA polymerase sigma factor (sigma-70 family)